MIPPIRHSLLMNQGIVMTIIILLTFASMVASLVITDTMQGLATAINESGALRMRSYRIASSLVYEVPDDQHWKKTKSLINGFEHHLISPDLISAIPENQTHILRLAYTQIELQWQEEIKPLFDVYLDGIINLSTTHIHSIDMSISENAVINLRNRYLLVVGDFVNNIDRLVTLLEQDAESKIKYLRYFQIIALILTILLVLIALSLVYKCIQKPIKQLLVGTKSIKNSDFSFRASYTGHDEVGRLGTAFNLMAENLSGSYTELEDRVKQKTLDLRQSNCSLEFLYKTVKRLNETDSPHTTFQYILEDIEQLLGTGRGSICLNDNKKATKLATTLHDNDLSHQLCINENCNYCLNDNKAHKNVLSTDNNDSKTIITIPINDKIKQYGVLIIEPTKNKDIEPWQLQLLETIASHIGMAIKLSQQAADTRRHSLIEERGAIARELHDSLAQSLTFMKIQVSRLQANTQKNQLKSDIISNTNSDTDNIIAELRIGLNSAYKELRELLTTFRLNINNKLFSEAINETVIEFNERSKTIITFDNQVNYYNLTPNEEIHILQLVRESLANITQHAKASTANVIIKYENSGNMQITINDNGIGIKLTQPKTHHYGLSIMKERAKTLNGELKISNNPNGGTQIILTFSPEYKIIPITRTKAKET